jgi:hypothetical protein
MRCWTGWWPVSWLFLALVATQTSGHASRRRTIEDENGGRDASAAVPTRPAGVTAPLGKCRGFRESFNVPSLMGPIMVSGIVAKNGILLMDADQRARAQGASAVKAMVQAGLRRWRERFRWLWRCG